MIYAISDLHLAGTTDKTMDKFGWINHVEKIEKNWKLTDEDTAIIAGDLSWALKINETIPDFEFLSKLKGKKVLLKGNHDIWWNSQSKLNTFLSYYKNFDYIFNNSLEIEGINICGTRGWDINKKSEEDIKILKREVGRLELSLNSATLDKKIVFMHFPPILKSNNTDMFTSILKKHGIEEVYYGHLHGTAINDAIQGKYDGIYYKCIACDQNNFTPILLN